ncbi:hypothetical protein KAR91_72915 [Candidatus Pacearchaeota archaeon]|nr:hypothetical protein [Candidatus Pacearchaeota archaeon]
MGASSIFVSPELPLLRREALAGAAGILPGHLLIQSGADVIVNATAEDVPVRALFADLSIGEAGDITRAYVDNETVNYGSASKGSFVTARFGGGITLAVNAEVASAGDGTLKAPAVAGTGVLGYVTEVVTSGAGATSGVGLAVIEIL